MRSLFRLGWIANPIWASGAAPHSIGRTHDRYPTIKIYSQKNLQSVGRPHTIYKITRGGSAMTRAPPSADIFKDLAARHAGTVVIMNLLKFKTDAGDGRTGRRAYADYGALAAEILPVYGAEVVWTGRQREIINGGAQDDWDIVALVRYPSIDALARMSASPEYRAIYHHRTAALEREAVTALSEDFALGELGPKIPLPPGEGGARPERAGRVRVRCGWHPTLTHCG